MSVRTEHLHPCRSRQPPKLATARIEIPGVPSRLGNPARPQGADRRTITALSVISGTTCTMSGPSPIGIAATASVRSAGVTDAPGRSVTAVTATCRPSIDTP